MATTQYQYQALLASQLMRSEFLHLDIIDASITKSNSFYIWLQRVDGKLEQRIEWFDQAILI